MRPKLIVLRGLPASGKSLYAKRLVMEKSFKRLSKDDLRSMIDDGLITKDNEKLINHCQNIIAGIYLRNNYNVVLDNYNLNPYHVKLAQQLAKQNNADFEVYDFYVPVHICVERDLHRDNGRVGKDVIMKLHYKWFKAEQMPDLSKLGIQPQVP